MPTLAQQLIKSFHALGVRYVFGIPGGPSIPYLEAMRQYGIEFVLVSNEQSAAIMADVFGRLTGIPGVCHATFGPGATNLSTGIGGALLDRSPVIALTTEVKDADIGRKVQMNINHQALYRPITKWTVRLSKENFAETIKEAFITATSGVPGPVHIGLPADIDGVTLGQENWTDFYEQIPFLQPDHNRLEKVAEIMTTAKKPILAIGVTAVRNRLASPIRDFVNKNNIPVILTPMAKGIIDEANPCYAGVVFHAKSDFVASIYRNADLVIGIGYDPIEFNYENWMPKVPLVHFDSEPADITADYQCYEVLGDLNKSLAFLNEKVFPNYAWNLQRLQKNKIDMFQALMPKSNTFTPSQLIATLQEEMPENGILTSDVGAHLHLLGQLWKVDEPNRFIITNGWSAMGFGIPSAIGAKLCRPDHTVVCISGDGGFLMNCGELITARRLGIGVVFVVLCDRNLSLIEVKQIRKNVTPYGTELYQGEYFAAETFLGIPVLTARNQREMQTALKTAFSMTTSVIIEAFVDGASYQDLIASTYK